MNNLITSNEVVRMTSKELCDLINIFRREEGNNTVKEHKDLMKSIRTELDALSSAGIEDEGNFSLVDYIDSKGEKRPCYSLTEEAVMQMLNKESAVVRYKTQQYIKALKKQLAGKTLDFNRVFGKYRLRKSIREAQDVRQLFEDYIELSAIERTAGRMTNKDRIYSLDTFADEIENIVANEAVNMRGSQLLALQELLTDISKEKNRLSNKMRGGVISNKTRKIRQLEEELAMTKEDDDNWFLIERHPFSNNYLHDYVPGGRVNSVAYKAWINNLNLSQFLPNTYPGLDITKPMKLHLLYGHMDKFDTINFEKAIVDQISKYYGFDDQLIKKETQELHSYVNSYEEGYIYLKLSNIEEYEEDN